MHYDVRSFAEKDYFSGKLHTTLYTWAFSPHIQDHTQWCSHKDTHINCVGLIPVGQSTCSFVSLAELSQRLTQGLLFYTMNQFELNFICDLTTFTTKELQS